MLKNYLNTKKKYSKLFNSQCPEHEHISMIRLTSPKDTARFLASIDKLAPKNVKETFTEKEAICLKH